MAKSSSQLPSVHDIDLALKVLIGKVVAKPEGGSLAGHAAGLPFEDLVHQTLRNTYGNRVQRHFEALNSLFLATKSAKDYESRLRLLGPKSLQFLLKRGKKSINEWTPSNLFEVKQDDTAESIIFPTSDIQISSEGVLLVDVKTQDIGKKAQAPNIMSADKLARACVFALEGGDKIPFEILYVGVKWEKESKHLRCVDVRTISLMKIDPRNIYINWVAAQQIQFHPFDVLQDYEGNREQWCKSYLNVFCHSLESRIDKEIERLDFFRKTIKG